MTKATKWHVHPAKTQMSSLSAWRKLGSLANHWAHSKDSDQTGRMPRLIWVFAGRIATLLVLSWGGLNCLVRVQFFHHDINTAHLGPNACRKWGRWDRWWGWRWPEWYFGIFQIGIKFVKCYLCFRYWRFFSFQWYRRSCSFSLPVCIPICSQKTSTVTSTFYPKMDKSVWFDSAKAEDLQWFVSFMLELDQHSHVE